MDVIFEKCLKKTGINIRESPGGLPFYECAYIVSYIYIRVGGFNHLEKY